MKKIITLALALSLAIASSQALAASAKCTVTAVSENIITLDCGNKSKSFKSGDTLKVKVAKAKKAIEGC